MNGQAGGMKRFLFRVAGMLAVILGVIGMVLPLLPTVPFMILAAYFFGRSSPAFERRLLEHRMFGPHIRAWRDRRAIARAGKYGATGAFVASALGGLWLLDGPARFAPLAVAVVGIALIWSRPDA